MKYQINSTQLEEFIDHIWKYITKMDEQIIVMKDLINKTKWQGNAHDAALINYNKLITELENIPYTLRLYINFLKTLLTKYGEGNKEIKKSFKEIVEKLELERKKYEL